jgi:hypothetical protein
MAFILSGITILSFAEYQDVVDADQRLFDENEGLTDQIVEDILIRSTERILAQIKTTNWYKDLAYSQGASALTMPDVDASKIIANLNDFTDLCVYHSLYEYILPKIADFGNENNAERVKIEFYRSKYSNLFTELLSSGDWYDYNNDGTLNDAEFKPAFINYQRVR